ncbi:MAG TPA: NADP-dependent oxidoreductase [Stellaceae bacterium]|nr:NADP-dependent oxidoreductase [Stellaceae bacterium]
MNNRQWRIAARPLRRPLAEADFAWHEEPASAPPDGQVLVRALYLGFDPAQKGWMENVSDYVPPTEIGDVMRAFGVGEVVTSRSGAFAAGDKVTGFLGWQDYALVEAAALTKVPDDELLTANLGVLGVTGYTALLGLHKIGRPFPGDTMVVTGAAGGVGSLVGQLGKIAGCRVIGIAGGREKCDWLVGELGFDAAVDYKSTEVRKALRGLAPDGVDIVWDNVGGKVLNDLLARLAQHGRVVVCGAISIYSEAALPPGPANYMNLVFKRARMEGFIVLDHEDEFPWARERLVRLLRDGRLKYAEDVRSGLENAPHTLLRLFDGSNRGKQILKVAA